MIEFELQPCHETHTINFAHPNYNYASLFLTFQPDGQPKEKEHESAYQGWGEDSSATEGEERLVQTATRQQKAQYAHSRCGSLHMRILRAEPLHHRSDERGRDNAMRRDRQAAPAPYAYDFRIKEGQEVGYLGDAWPVV